jgi:uncharacterized protein YggU (UPF0235/DUF167 family)
LKVRVAAPPEDGRANDAVLELLARTFDLPRRDVRLATGASSRDRVVVLEGMTDEAAEGVLVAAAEGRR